MEFPEGIEGFSEGSSMVRKVGVDRPLDLESWNTAANSINSGVHELTTAAKRDR